MSPIEALAALLILVNVWLVARRSIWNYAFGLTGTLLYAWVFFGAKLYSDMVLQGFFVVAQLYGWRQWVQSRQAAGEVVVERLEWPARAAWAVGIGVAALLWGTAMHRFTDAALPYWDAANAMIAVAAQILMSVRRLENWWLWIATNMLTIGLCATRHLWLTVGLYGLLLALSVWGLAKWRAAGHSAAA